MYLFEERFMRLWFMVDLKLWMFFVFVFWILMELVFIILVIIVVDNGICFLVFGWMNNFVDLLKSFFLMILERVRKNGVLYFIISFLIRVKLRVMGRLDDKSIFLESGLIIFFLIVLFRVRIFLLIGLRIGESLWIRFFSIVFTKEINLDVFIFLIVLLVGLYRLFFIIFINIIGRFIEVYRFMECFFLFLVFIFIFFFFLLKNFICFVCLVCLGLLFLFCIRFFLYVW